MSETPRKTLGRALRRRPLTIAAVAISAALALTACSGGGSAAPAATSSNGLVSVNVLRSTGSTFEPLYIGQEQGFFADEGIDLTITEGAADTSANVPSIVNGEAQFAMTDSSGFIKGVAAGLPVQAVANLQSSDAAEAPSDGLLVLPTSGIASFKDLEGKTVGLPALGGTLQMVCDYLIKKDGGDPTKVNFVALPVASLVSAVQSGQIDGAYTFATFYDAGKAAGLTALGNGTNDLPGLSQALLFASTQYLSANADTTTKFVAALTKSIDYANANPQAVRDVDTKYTKLSAADIANRTIQTFGIKFDTGTMDAVVDTMSEFGLISTKPTTDIFWSGAPKTS